MSSVDEVLDAPTVRLAATPAPAGRSFRKPDPFIRRTPEAVSLPELGRNVMGQAAAALPTTRSRILAAAAVAATVLVGASIAHGNKVADTTDSAGRPLAYSPESAVLNNCPGASSSEISAGREIDSANDGTPIYAVPWTDGQGHTHAAWVLSASRTAPSKYRGTYRATVCNWVNVN